MPPIQPQIDAFPIPNLKSQESFGNSPQLQNFSPTPRTIMRNAYTPKTLSFQEVLFHLGYPKSKLMKDPKHQNAHFQKVVMSLNNY